MLSGKHQGVEEDEDDDGPVKGLSFDSLPARPAHATVYLRQNEIGMEKDTVSCRTERGFTLHYTYIKNFHINIYWVFLW